MNNYRHQRPLRRYRKKCPYLGRSLDLEPGLTRLTSDQMQSWPVLEVDQSTQIMVYVKDRRVCVDECWNGSWVTVASMEMPAGTGLLKVSKSGCSYDITFINVPVVRGPWTANNPGQEFEFTLKGETT